jgi:hypothetical protein
VFSLNRESVGVGVDWRQNVPGSTQVDVMGLSYYNQWPHVTNQTEWAASVNQVDQYGAPKGIGQHLAFARSQGLRSGSASGPGRPNWVTRLTG